MSTRQTTDDLQVLKAREQVMFDLHDALGVPFGADPFAAISLLKAVAPRGPLTIDGALVGDVLVALKTNGEWLDFVLSDDWEREDYLRVTGEMAVAIWRARARLVATGHSDPAVSEEVLEPSREAVRAALDLCPPDIHDPQDDQGHYHPLLDDVEMRECLRAAYDVDFHVPEPEVTADETASTEMTYQEFVAMWAGLADDQRESLRLKAQAEGMSLWAVANHWPQIWNDEQRLAGIRRDRLHGSCA